MPSVAVFVTMLILTLLFVIGTVCTGTAAREFAAKRQQRRLAACRPAQVPQRVETEEQRHVAMHKRINNKERQTQQPLSVWSEPDGFIGTYDTDGSRVWGEGVERPAEVEVWHPTPSSQGVSSQAFLSASVTSPLDGYEGVRFVSLPKSMDIEVKSHQQGMSTLYEVRLPIQMDPAAAHDYAESFLKMLHVKDPQCVHFDCAFIYGPYVMASSCRVDDWRTTQWQWARQAWEQEIVRQHSIPIHVLGIAQAAPVWRERGSGCQCGVCGPDLGPMWDHLEKDMSPLFTHNRAAVHDMYEQRRDYESQRAERDRELRRAKAERAGYEILAGRKPPEPMPDNLRAVWKAHESA